MKSIGSPVKVGKMDATSYSSKLLFSLLFYCFLNDNVLITWSSIQGKRKTFFCLCKIKVILEISDYIFYELDELTIECIYCNLIPNIAV